MSPHDIVTHLLEAKRKLNAALSRAPGGRKLIEDAEWHVRHVLAHGQADQLLSKLEVATPYVLAGLRTRELAEIMAEIDSRVDEARSLGSWGDDPGEAVPALAAPRRVSDDQIAALVALVTQEFPEFYRLVDHLSETGGLREHVLLVEAACFVAVERRFGGETEDAEIGRFVARVGRRFDDNGVEFDTAVAERVVRSILAGEPDDDIDTDTFLRIEMAVLCLLVSEAELGADGLSEFIASARELADDLIADESWRASGDTELKTKEG